MAPFKKGPDYIDAGWLSRAAGRPCYNLDTYLCAQSVVQTSYLTHSQSCDIAMVEGNRGLYDGIQRARKRSRPTAHYWRRGHFRYAREGTRERRRCLAASN